MKNETSDLVHAVLSIEKLDELLREIEENRHVEKQTRACDAGEQAKPSEAWMEEQARACKAGEKVELSEAWGKEQARAWEAGKAQPGQTMAPTPPQGAAGGKWRHQEPAGDKWPHQRPAGGKWLHQGASGGQGPN